MVIVVKNRNEVEAGVPIAEDHVMISISCPNDPAIIPDNEFRKDLLRLEFHDLDQPSELLEGTDCKLFSKEDAKKILEFFNKHKTMCEYLIVHCDAGISRSPAVAAALTKIQGHHDLKFFRNFIPNRRVYSLIMSMFYEGEK